MIQSSLGQFLTVWKWNHEVQLLRISNIILGDKEKASARHCPGGGLTVLVNGKYRKVIYQSLRIEKLKVSRFLILN